MATSGAKQSAVALIFGDDELTRGEVSVKPLRDAHAAQFLRPLAQAGAWAHELRPLERSQGAQRRPQT